MKRFQFSIEARPKGQPAALWLKPNATGTIDEKLLAALCASGFTFAELEETLASLREGNKAMNYRAVASDPASAKELAEKRVKAAKAREKAAEKAAQELQRAAFERAAKVHADVLKGAAIAEAVDHRSVAAISPEMQAMASAAEVRAACDAARRATRAKAVPVLAKSTIGMGVAAERGGKIKPPVMKVKETRVEFSRG